MSKTGHVMRVLKYGVLEPVLSLAVNHANPLFSRPGQVAPPDWLNFAGGGDFERMGRDNMSLLRRHGGLRADDRLLEIGCGIGRNAAYLPEHIPNGSYDGFDVVRSGIHWCRRRIARHHPNFRFVRVNVHNGFYNPFGTIDPIAFRFPYGSDGFDLVFAFSVFTHMLWDETVAYLAKSQRVLTPGGRMLFTAFVLDDRARDGIDRGRATFSFAKTCGKNPVEDAHSPHLTVAYKSDEIARLLADQGFTQSHLLPGGWSGEAKQVSFQDIVVATKA